MPVVALSVTRALVQLAQCDDGQSSIECNTATASFVLVEQLRYVHCVTTDYT